VIEQAFGILVKRFAVLSTFIKLTQDYIRRFIVALLVLHNFCLETNDDLQGIFLIEIFMKLKI